jgi:hypothetical protein
MYTVIAGFGSDREDHELLGAGFTRVEVRERVSEVDAVLHADLLTAMGAARVWVFKSEGSTWEQVL